MIDQFPHVSASTAKLFGLTDEERLQTIHRDRWVTYDRANRFLKVFETLLALPRTTRMPSIAIYADSGMGKTMLMEKFRRDHPPRFNFNEGREVAPVLATQMASRPTERRFYGQLLHAIGVPFGSRSTLVDLEIQALRNLKRMEVKILLIDEVHNILAGTAAEQRIILNLLRYLSNELRLSLVCLGVGEAREAISGDVQLARRFEELPLPRWRGNEEFQELILTIVRNLTLQRPSVLSPRSLRRVLQATDGITAKIFRLFNDLAIEAIRSGDESLSDEAVQSWRPLIEPEAVFA
jgi:hypothetical protein